MLRGHTVRGCVGQKCHFPLLSDAWLPLPPSCPPSQGSSQPDSLHRMSRACHTLGKDISELLVGSPYAQSLFLFLTQKSQAKFSHKVSLSLWRRSSCLIA